jgi:hypothetical protein
MKRATAHLSMLRNKLGAFAERLHSEATEGTINTLAVRRHLTELETALLDLARERDCQAQALATGCRTLLNAEEVVCHEVLAFVVELDAYVGLSRESRTLIATVLNKIRHELRRYIVDAERTA